MSQSHNKNLILPDLAALNPQPGTRGRSTPFEMQAALFPEENRFECQSARELIRKIQTTIDSASVEEYFLYYQGVSDSELNILEKELRAVQLRTAVHFTWLKLGIKCLIILGSPAITRLWRIFLLLLVVSICHSSWAEEGNWNTQLVYHSWGLSYPAVNVVYYRISWVIRQNLVIKLSLLSVVSGLACFPFSLFSLLNKLFFFTGEKNQWNRSEHDSYLTFNFSLLLAFSKVLLGLSIPNKWLCNSPFRLPLIGFGWPPSPIRVNYRRVEGKMDFCWQKGVKFHSFLTVSGRVATNTQVLGILYLSQWLSEAATLGRVEIISHCWACVTAGVLSHKSWESNWLINRTSGYGRGKKAIEKCQSQISREQDLSTLLFSW